MSPRILDACALLAFFEDEPGADSVREIIQSAFQNGDALLMSVVNVGEVWYAIARSSSPEVADRYVTEYEIAAILGAEAQKRGVQPIVNLVATDDRRYRHPLPTARKLERYALLVLSGRWRGLVCSVSRMVHFGKPPAELERKTRAAARVNAAFIAHSRPGKTLGELLHIGQTAYAEAGFPGEWQHHHQGGVTGYEPREYLATPGGADVLAAGQALAWNPTVQGAKMEDTILLGENGNEILTPTPLWPVEPVELPGLPPVPCPLLLER